MRPGVATLLIGAALVGASFVPGLNVGVWATLSGGAAAAAPPDKVAQTPTLSPGTKLAPTSAAPIRSVATPGLIRRRAPNSRPRAT